MIPALRAIGRLARRPQARAVGSIGLGLLAVGTVFYSLVEKWSLLDSLYFSVVTLTTTGYGDLSPETAAGKVFTIFYLLSGVGVFVAIVAAIAREAFSLRGERMDLADPETPDPSESRPL